LGELVGTRHRERHSNQIVQTYTKFQNEIFWFSTSRATSDSVSIWYWVHRAYFQSGFMIISDLMKMVVVLCFMFYMNWQLTWIVVVAMPVLVLPGYFNARCKWLLRTYETKFQTWIPSCKNA
jgi:ABC-type bacteriocin/lantibiotic exporter with double-glycine peptidase domain